VRGSPSVHRRSAEREYIESDPIVTLKYLARKYKLIDRTVEKWAAADNWVERRRRHWLEVQRKSELAAQKATAKVAAENAAYLAERRARIPKEHADNANQLRTLIIGKMLEEGRSVLDLQKLASALKNVADLERLSTGLTSHEVPPDHPAPPDIKNTLLGDPLPDPGGGKSDPDDSGPDDG